MAKKIKRGPIKPTTLVLVLIIIGIVGYIGASRLGGFSLASGTVNLSESKDIITLDIKDNDYIGLNSKQIIRINRDGITAYDLEGYEIWSDTLSANNYIVKQREPYIAVGTKDGRQISLFNTKGKVTDIVCDNKITYFSVNEQGGVSVIQDLEGGNMVAAYDVNGRYLGGMVSYTKMEGYPTNVELSPDNKLLIVSYLKTDEPVLTSSIRAIAMQQSSDEEGEGVKYGFMEKDNLIYEIEFIKDNVWVGVGDKKITWYDLGGNEIKSITNINSVFRPYLYKRSSYGDGFLPIVATDNAAASIIHRKDKLTFWDAKGAKTFETDLQVAADYIYADSRGVIVGAGNQFAGYNKIGTQIFSYKSSVDVNKVFYLSESRKGIAVTKEKVMLLTPKRKVG
nr:DUF5711 family protein [uncultured Cellulosilyticum sp.]